MIASILPCPDFKKRIRKKVIGSANLEIDKQVDTFKYSTSLVRKKSERLQEIRQRRRAQEILSEKVPFPMRQPYIRSE